MKLLCALFILTIASKAFAFDWNIHRSITARALKSQGFSSKASHQIAEANTEVDSNEASNTANHVDSENFEAASLLLRSRLKTTALLIINNDMLRARITFGYVTHTVQDFYSHTNYVEYMKGAPIDLLNLKNPSSSAPCSKNNMTSSLTSGYFPDSSTPTNKCSHTMLNKDSGNFSSRGAEAIQYASLATVNIYSVLEKEVISLSANYDQAMKILSAFKDSDNLLFHFNETKNESNLNYIYYNDRYRIIPFLGTTSYHSNTNNFESSYSSGVRAETRVSDAFVTGLGLTLSTLDVLVNSQKYNYTNYGIDLFTKFYLFTESRFQPYLGAGIGYGRGQLSINESSVTSNLKGELLGGMNLMFTNLIGAALEAKFAKPISSSSSLATLPQTNEQDTLEKLRNEIEDADNLTLSAGLVISF